MPSSTPSSTPSSGPTPIPTPNCGPQEYHVTFEARALSQAELKNANLPLVASKKYPVETILLGQNQKKSPHGRKYNELAQQLFAVDLTLPPKKAVTKIRSVEIKASLLELVPSHGSNPGARALCLLDEKFCSGDVTSCRSDAQKAFSKGGFSVKNENFLHELRLREVEQISCDLELAEDKDLRLPLEDILAKRDDLLELLYKGNSSDLSSHDRTLRFGIIDDFNVQSFKIEVDIDLDTCKLQLPPANPPGGGGNHPNCGHSKCQHGHSNHVKHCKKHQCWKKECSTHSHHGGVCYTRH